MAYRDVDWHFLLHDTRARVYLLWAVICAVGFTSTHFYMNKLINPVWFVLTAVGLGYMWRVMPLRVAKMKQILICWVVVLLFGMAVSGLVFQVDQMARLIPYLGVFWLLFMGVGYAWNGLIDPPSKWYWFAVVINVLAAVLCLEVHVFLLNQYLVAAIISTWSMLYLWLLRT